MTWTPLQRMPEERFNPVPFGMTERDVFSDDEMRAFNLAPHKGRQRPWEKGLTTGGDRG